MQKINIGDQVKLKLTETKMKVTGFDGIFYKCEWIEGNKEHIGYFLFFALEVDILNNNSAG